MNPAGTDSPSSASGAPRLNLGVPPQYKAGRLISVDLLRGLVMVVMALDHVRDYFTNVRFYPLDLTQTWPSLFLTRWITHFCAPTFVFLAGTGAFLAGTRGKSRPELSRFLLIRGLWLILLELTVVRFGWVFNFDYSLMIGQVIWAIGWSMIALSGLVFLPITWVTVVGVGMILVHNAFDAVTPSQFGGWAWIWTVLHEGGTVEVFPGAFLEVAYPLVPWIGVMAAGYGFGTVLQQDGTARKKMLLRIGVGMIVTFVVLRTTNLYGDPRPWTGQSNFLFTVFDFIHCQKYPPSLLFLLMTLGPAIVSLAFLEQVKGKVGEFIIVFGRVPLFYYILHIPLIHGLALIAASTTGYGIAFMLVNAPPWEWPQGYGFDLPVVYLVWVVVILSLYPACRWFAGVKRKSKNPLLSYL